MSELSGKILVVDDHAGTRRVLAEMLIDAGHQCVRAPSAITAADILRRQEFDIVLLDITMPGKTGMDFLPEIRARHPDSAVIMLTGMGDLSTGVKAMREGARDYLTKPVSRAEFLARIELAIHGRSIILQNKACQRRQKETVTKLNELLEQRQRELAALNKLFQSHLREGSAGRDEYEGMKESLTLFGSELEGLTSLLASDEPDEKDP